MIKFFYNLSNYKPVKVLPEIKRVIKIDRQKLQDGIDTFQDELDWQQMWTVEDSEKRLEDGWWFYVMEKSNKYIGWAWFDTPNKQFCNLYVHKDYRDRGYGKELVYARLNECKKQNIQKVWMEVNTWNKPIQKIGQELEWTPKIHYTFWTGGYDSTFLVCKFLLEGKIVQPIYIDDRVNHGGYHSNPLIVQRGEPDEYPRKSTEIELERMDWLRDKIYDRIPNSKELLLDPIVIDEPIKENEEISKIVKKYNEWEPDTLVIVNGNSCWLAVYVDLISRFQKQFGIIIDYPNEKVDWSKQYYHTQGGEFFEILDVENNAIDEYGNFDSSKLPEKYKDLGRIFSGFRWPLRYTDKFKMLEEAEQLGFDDLLYYTWTCWYPTKGAPCGECHVCNERIIECKEI